MKTFQKYGKPTAMWVSLCVFSAVICTFAMAPSFPPAEPQSADWEGVIGEVVDGNAVITCDQQKLKTAFLGFLTENKHGVSRLSALSIIEVEGSYYLLGKGSGSESVVELELDGEDQLSLARLKTTITCSGCGTCGIQQEVGFPCSTCQDPPSCNRTETKDMD